MSSQRIPHSIRFAEEEYLLFAPEELWTHALWHWKSYQSENQIAKTQPPPLPPFSWAPLFVLIPPIFVYFLPLFVRNAFIDKLGRVDAEAVLQGQWWRLFTAQTLHADARHIAGNLASGFFLLLLSRKHLPLGWTAFLMALAAACANFTNSFLRQEHYFSIGFSTFTFALLGALVAWESLVLIKNKTEFNFKILHPIFAGFTLTFLMSAGENTDVAGHLYGFVYGAILALFANFFPKKQDDLLGLKALFLSWILYFVAWGFAFTFG